MYVVTSDIDCFVVVVSLLAEFARECMSIGRVLGDGYIRDSFFRCHRCLTHCLNIKIGKCGWAKSSLIEDQERDFAKICFLFLNKLFMR